MRWPMAACCGNDGGGLHARLVEVLEGLAGDRGAEQVDRLAHHALRAEAWAKAVPYCQQAGVRAHDRGAFRAAVGAFEQALQALAHLRESHDTVDAGPRSPPRVGEARCTPWPSMGGFGTVLDEAEAQARALDDRPRLGRVLAGQAGRLRVTGDPVGAIAAGRPSRSPSSAASARCRSTPPRTWGRPIMPSATSARPPRCCGGASRLPTGSRTRPRPTRGSSRRRG